MTSDRENQESLLAEKETMNGELSMHRQFWAELENSLAILLFRILRSPANSRIAQAIYFSPDGFYARQSIVNNAITQWIRERNIFDKEFHGYWKRANYRLAKARDVRNSVAHGTVQILKIRAAPYVRLVAPIFDPKLSHLAEKGTIPGLTQAELTRSVLCLSLLGKTMATFSRGVEEAYDDTGPLHETFPQLEEHLNQIDSLYPAAPNGSIP